MRQTVTINDNGGEKRQKEFAMNETCMNHALNMPNIGCCPYCRIAELEQQLAHKQEQCDQLAHQVLELEEQNERDRYHGRDFIRLWKEGKEHIAELEQQLARYQSKYNNLLAVAHRDGGQYLARHGEEKAGEDAITEILTAYHNNDRYQGGVEVDGVWKQDGILFYPLPTVQLEFNQKVRVLVIPDRIVDANKTMKEVE